MPSDTVAEVWEAVRRFEGVPRWWAELFVNIGFSASDAVAWVTTAERDYASPLNALREKELNVTLQGYASARGIELLGAGAGASPTDAKSDRFIHWINTVVTASEQEAIVAEVGAYADVRFREKINGVYTQHAVANAVRSVHQGFLDKVAASDGLRLEAGASVKNVVLSGATKEKVHCCSPVLDVRDSVRHSINGWLRMVAEPDSKFKDTVRAAASAALDEESGFVCRSRVQDCTRQVDIVCSNESTHDIPFDDLPLVMARHGARLWVGFMTRAVGVRRTGGPTSGACSVLGTRWRLDRSKDTITFHFSRDGSFSYTHKFSEWIKYEEQFGFRWSGVYFDYVYTRMPITTKSSLAFIVARVPKSQALIREPVYKSSSMAGMVEITSIKAAGGCIGVVKPKFEPFTFSMEALVFDRAIEKRFAEGERGNLASTIAYLRSARVRLAVNGVALGVVTSVPVDVLEPAAVAIEVLVADGRRAGERDYEAVIRASTNGDSFLRIFRYFTGLTRWVGSKPTAAAAAVKGALAAALDGTQPVVVKAVRCDPYVRVSDGTGSGVVSEVPALVARDCGCTELIAVNAALKSGSLLSRSERRELTAYAATLKQTMDTCVVHNVHLVPEVEAEDMFFDALDEQQTETTASGSGSSVVSVETSELDTVSEVCTDLTSEDGTVPLPKEDVDGGVVSAIREYASWAQRANDCARTEAALACDVLFQRGNPTLGDVERSTTARTRHAVVTLINGKVAQVFGTLRDEEQFAEVYVRSLKRTCIVHTGKGKSRYIKEPVTELAYTSSLLLVMNGDDLCRSALRVLMDLPRGFSFPRYTFVNGVPGCGKTHDIIEKTLSLVEQGKSVVYLTATKASSEKVQEVVAKRSGQADAIVCRTYDSYLINGAVPVGGGSVDMLFMDEAPMAHKGELFACMVKVAAATVELYGDTKQIPWLPFMASFEAKYATFENEFFVVEKCMTHRFGKRTCAMWLDVYGRFYPCECHEHSDDLPVVVRVTSGSQVPSLNSGKILTFTQEEKVTVKREVGLTDTITVLKARDNGGLSTVAEDQGGTHMDVGIARLVNKRNPKESAKSPSIYNKQPWVLVATTRHKRRLVYYTTADDDLVTARMALARCAVRVEAVEQKRHWDEVAHKATHVRVFGV